MSYVDDAQNATMEDSDCDWSQHNTETWSSNPGQQVNSMDGGGHAPWDASPTPSEWMAAPEGSAWGDNAFYSIVGRKSPSGRMTPKYRSMTPANPNRALQRPPGLLASIMETKVKNRFGALTAKDGTCECSSSSSRTETVEDSLARESSARAPSSQEEIQVQHKSCIVQDKTERKLAKRQRGKGSKHN